MKPTKSNKKVSSENKQNSSIQNFFQTKKSIACTSSDVKSVYVHALVDKLSYDEEIVSNQKSSSERENGEIDVIASTPEQKPDQDKPNKSNRCEACGRVDEAKGCNRCDWRAKYEESKKSRIKLSLLYTELLMKYNELAKVATGSGRSNGNFEEKSAGDPQVVSESDGPQMVSTSDDPQMVYASNGASQASSSSADIFTETEMKLLQCIPLHKKNDSTFVLNCVQYAYKDNAASLTNQTLKGTRARFEVNEDGDLVMVKPEKNPLTPEKVRRIHQLFIDRVEKSKCMAAEFGERMKLTNFNQLIGSAVKNIANKEKAKAVLSNQNPDLGL